MARFLEHIGGHAWAVPGAMTVLASLFAAALAGCAAVPSDTAVGPSGSTPPVAGSGPPVSGSGAPAGAVRVYTSVPQATVDAMVAAFKAADPGAQVDVYRAATGDIAARTAAEQRQGGIQADVLWLTDPLSMQGYAQAAVLDTWQPTDAASIPAEYHTETYWGTRLLDIVMVAAKGLSPMPADWKDLTDPSLRGAVAIPNPGFAGSAFAALAYFGLNSQYGIAFYQGLASNGAVQVQSPDDVVTGVAEGKYKAGITLDSSIRTATAKGSPVQMVWPTSGAIAIYGPIGLVKGAANSDAGRRFADYVLSPGGQGVMAAAGWQPVRRGVSGGPAPQGKQVSFDWAAATQQQKQLMDQYQQLFGGG